MTRMQDDDTQELAAAAEARRARDSELTPIERLQKLDDLLRAAAAIQALPRKSA